MDVRILTILTLPLFSNFAFAHAGHDHSHWLSGFVHLLWIAPVFLGVALIVFAINYLDKKTNSGDK